VPSANDPIAETPAQVSGLPTARSLRTQEQRQAQILGTLQPCTRSLSQQPLTSPGRVLGDLPSGVVVVNSYMVSAAQSARRIVVNSRPSPDGGSREAPGSTFPHGLPREAGGRQKRLLGAQVGLRNSGPPASTCGHSRLDGAPSGTRLGTQIPIEDSNCNRIRTLEGRRPRIESPVFLAEDRG